MSVVIGFLIKQKNYFQAFKQRTLHDYILVADSKKVSVFGQCRVWRLRSHDTSHFVMLLPSLNQSTLLVCFFWSLAFLLSSKTASALDFRKALLSGLKEEDPATVSTQPHKKKLPSPKNKDTMGQCLSSLSQQTQEAVNDVLGAAAEATATTELVHAKLPSDAEVVNVRNVYDGDTLTLTDERRVRLVGIDTPELKEKQAYAQEAKMYTKDRCNKQQIWISYAGNEKEDHYGRLLALVWVKAPGGYLCINEGIVAAGFARAYRPSQDTKISNWNTLLKLQKTARAQGVGVWKNFQDLEVVKTANGSAYHKRSCEHISHVKRLTSIKISAAMEQGLHPCRTCYG